MSKYLRQIVYKGEFDGDAVTLTMNHMETADVLTLRDLSADTVASTFQPLIAKYLVSVEGLTAADGTPVTKEEFCAALYFLPVLVDAGMALINGSRVANPTPPAS